MHTYFGEYASPIGKLLLVADPTSLLRISMVGQNHEIHIEGDWQRKELHPPIKRTIEQLSQYFAGRRRSFDLPLQLAGTDFEQRVWAEISRIPLGKTISYGELARRLGNAKAARAVGHASGKNPIAIVVPCHRVIGANGAMTGYSSGLSRKEFLLQLERSFI